MANWRRLIMKNTSKTIVFFGNERLATGVKTSAPTLQALIKARYNVAAVIVNNEHSKSRSKQQHLEIEDIAKANNIPVLLPKKLIDIEQQLKDYGASVGVLIAYGKIVPQSIIDIFPKGIINIHPSLLPKHRGPTPIESAILNNDSDTGVSIMQLTKDMDAGPVFAQSQIKLDGTETKQYLADTLLNIGGAMLLDILPEILHGNIVALPQDISGATYDNLLSKKDGVVDWRKPAQQIEREIRAFMNWPKSHVKIGDRDVIITKARAVSDIDLLENIKCGEIITTDDYLAIKTGKGALILVTVKPAGKKEMTSKAFLVGNKIIQQQQL